MIELMTNFCLTEDYYRQELMNNQAPKYPGSIKTQKVANSSSYPKHNQKKISSLVVSQLPGNDNNQISPPEIFPPEKSPLKISPPEKTNFLETTPNDPEKKPFKPQKLPLIFKGKQSKSLSSPGITILTPSGYGKSWRKGSIGIGLQSRARFTDKADGVFGIGLGLGDAKKSVGLDINLGIADMDEFKNGSVSWKLHRMISDDLSVAIGVKNFITFGNTDGGTSAYGVVTKMFSLQDNQETPFSRFYVSAGIGGGQFRSESDIKNKVDSLGLFGSVAIKVTRPVNAIVEWSGQDLSLGLSIAPFKKIPLVITPAISDITGNAGDGTRFLLGIGYGISF